MKRFNLLLVNQETGLGHAALKALSKTYRSNFIFEVASMEEAEKMLGKLHIDCMIVDLDKYDADFIQLSKANQSLMVFGVSKSPNRVNTAFDPDIHRIFSKDDFSAALQAEFKLIRKSGNLPQRKQQAAVRENPASAADFRDFSKLVGALN